MVNKKQKQNERKKNLLNKPHLKVRKRTYCGISLLENLLNCNRTVECRDVLRISFTFFSLFLLFIFSAFHLVSFFVLFAPSAWTVNCMQSSGLKYPLAKCDLFHFLYDFYGARVATLPETYCVAILQGEKRGRR